MVSRSCAPTAATLSPSTVPQHDYAGFESPDFRIFQLAASSVVTINGLIIRQGSVTAAGGFSASGGGININSGTLTLVDCTAEWTQGL